MTRPRRWLIAVAVTAALGALGALVAWDAVRFSPAGAGPDLSDPRRIAAGRPLYAAHCAACHGANREGQPDWTQRNASGRLPAPPHDDSGHTWHHPNAVLFAIAKHGMKPPHAPADYASDMPAFGALLSDEQIWAVLAYIQSHWSPQVRARHAQLERESHRH